MSKYLSKNLSKNLSKDLSKKSVQKSVQTSMMKICSRLEFRIYQKFCLLSLNTGVGFLKSLLIAHRGLDGWLGEYILVLLDSGHFYKCEIPGWLHNAEDYQLQCTTFDENKH